VLKNHLVEFRSSTKQLNAHAGGQENTQDTNRIDART